MLKQRARRIKQETYALYLAARHPHTPWFAKMLAAAIVAYALSPIDLIPDFIPVLGLLDDIILLPLAMVVAIRMIPDEVLVECRAQADTAFVDGKPVSRTAAAVIVAIWVVAAAVFAVWLWRLFAV